MKKETQIKVLTVSLIIGAGIIIIFYFVSPLLREIKNNSENLVGTRIAIDQLIAKTEAPKDDYEELHQFTETIEDLFISSQETIGAAVFLRELVKKHELEHEVKSIQLAESSEESWPYLNINLLVFGEPNSFFKFLKEVDSNKLLIRISETYIRKNDERNEINATMSLKIFYKE